MGYSSCVQRVIAAAGQHKSQQEAAEGSKANGASADTAHKHHPTLLRMLAAQLGCQVADIVDFELNVCDTQPGTLGGALCWACASYRTREATQ